MSNVIKLQDNEINDIKKGQEDLSQLIFRIGQLEVQQRNIFGDLDKVVAGNNSLGKKLQDKYGEGDINLETGELTLKEETKSTEKN